MPKLLTETKHFQAASQIRELVNTLSPGEVLPVASELMETLNISHGTAMRALKVLADEGVIVRPMGKLRYRIAERFERVSARISMVRPDFLPSPRASYTGGARGSRFSHTTTMPKTGRS